MKYCLSKYPKGSFPRQESDGRYMEGYLYSNLEPLAKKIKDDMTFMSVIYSSTLEVGTGKSVLAQQIGEAYTEMVNKFHGTNLTFDINNIVFTPKDLVDRSLHGGKDGGPLPRYSCIILDEWEDAHYWSELGIQLRQFFRKCRQLNLFMIVIIPNFFQLPINYAISRSVFAIDVKFEGEFERGYFSFYNFTRKKDLYLNGKKTYNFNCVAPNFSGRFTDGYAIPREVYLQRKKEDLEKADKDSKKVKEEMPIRYWEIKCWKELKGKFPIKNYTDWCEKRGLNYDAMRVASYEFSSENQNNTNEDHSNEF